MISNITIKDALKLGQLHGKAIVDADFSIWQTSEITGFNIESRQIKKGELFFALRGEHVDGHDYLFAAKEKGATAAVVEKVQDVDMPQLCVDKVEKSLGDFAAFVRRQFSGVVVGVTGSSGKTTIKNMLAGLLRQAGKVYATKGNFNNELGVPLSIASIEDDVKFAVIEMGAAQIGDIAYLGKIAKPQIALVSNVGHAHVGRFGGIENTAKAKGEIYQGLSSVDTAVINLDDQFSEFWISSIKAKKNPPRIIGFSRSKQQADVYLRSNSERNEIEVCVRRNIAAQSQVSFKVGGILPGSHNVENALAAISVAVAAGLSDLQIQQGFASGFDLDPGRLSLFEGFCGFDLIDDSYNANPESIGAAIDYLVGRAKEKQQRAVLVLGDMAELGAQSANHHFKVGEYAAINQIDELYCCGKNSGDYAAGFSQAASKKQSYWVADSQAVLIEKLRDVLDVASVVLVKGSRSAAMENVVAALKSSDLEVAPC